MKKIQITLLAAALIGVFSSHSFAGNRAVAGLAIGGASGAVAGQVIGRDAESTILGATIGGVLGAVLGSEMNHHHYGPPPVSQVVYHHRPAPPPPAVVYHHYPAPPPPVHHVIHKPKPRYVEHCRETVYMRDGHHRSRSVVSTVCYNDYNRPHHRSDRHDHFIPDRRWAPDRHGRF